MSKRDVSRETIVVEVEGSIPADEMDKLYCSDLGERGRPVNIKTGEEASDEEMVEIREAFFRPDVKIVLSPEAQAEMEAIGLTADEVLDGLRKSVGHNS